MKHSWAGLFYFLERNGGCKQITVVPDGFLLFGRVLAAYVVLLPDLGFVSACLPCIVQVSTEPVEFAQLVRVYSQLGFVYVFWWCHKGMVVAYLPT